MSPSVFWRTARPAPAAEDEERLAKEVRHVAIGQLLAGGQLVELVHGAGAILVATLVWNSLPVQRTIGWGLAIVAAAALRTQWRLHARRRNLPDEEALAGVRLTVAGIGLAWGVGAAFAIPDVPFEQAALILTVVAAIVAGGTSTLVGDTRTFLCLSVPMLAPLPVGILLEGHGRPQLVAIALTFLFAFGMRRIHGLAHRTFADGVRAAARQATLTGELVSQHAYLDGLLASAPVAISVIDDQGQVQGVNPQFERLFGYATEEAVGHDINALIVQKSEMPKASQLQRRTRGGDTVVLEVERRRKDGTVIPVRLSGRRVEGSAEGHIFVMYEDISDRRRAQDALTQLASIVETSEDAIIGQTLDGTVVSWNAAAQRMFGYTVGEIQGKHVAVLAPADRAGEVQAILERTAGTIGAKGLATLLEQVETAAAGGDVAQARTLGDRFVAESAAVTAYVRRARGGAA